MMIESVEEGCHSDGTPYYRECEEDIQMYLTLPLLGGDNGNAVLKVVWIIVALTYGADTWQSIWLIDEVCESNFMTINITVDVEMVSNFYFAN
jgi:hypothetical protein